MPGFRDRKNCGMSLSIEPFFVLCRQVCKYFTDGSLGNYGKEQSLGLEGIDKMTQTPYLMMTSFTYSAPSCAFIISLIFSLS